MTMRRRVAPRLLVSMVSLLGCSSNPPTHERDDVTAREGDVSHAGIPKRDELVTELAGLLDGLDEPGRARGLELARVLADDWLREAGDNELSQQVIELLRTELLAAASPLAPEARLDLLEAEVIDRELRPLSFESYELGKAVIDGTVIDAAATTRGREILARVEALGPRVRALLDAGRRRVLQRRLEEVMLEGLYAVERKAMSHRLGLYLKDMQGAVGPPDLRLRR